MDVWRWTGGATEVERRLRRERPEPSDSFVELLSERISARRRRSILVPRATFAFTLSTVLLAVAVAAVGGLGEAGSLASGAMSRASFHDLFFGGRTALEVQTDNAAVQQYGEEESTAPTTTTTTTTTTSTTTEETSPPPPTTGETSQQAAPGSSGEVTATAPGTTQTTTVKWAPETFPMPVVVLVDPTPEEVTNTALVGSGNQLVSVVAINLATGEQVRDLGAPLDIVFRNPVPGFVPVISTDGINFRAVPRVPGPTLPAGLEDGYYVDGAGAVHILTRHLTVFAVLYKANVKQSESGRPTKEPGSGLFGDPTRIHVGPPALRQVGGFVSTVRLAGGRGHEVRFTFLVDEQAVVAVSLLDRDRQVLLAMRGTRVRGHLLDGLPRKSLKLVILRPGTVNMRVRVPGRLLRPGRTYRIRLTATDYDGKRVVRFVAFRAD